MPLALEAALQDFEEQLHLTLPDKRDAKVAAKEGSIDPKYRSEAAAAIAAWDPRLFQQRIDRLAEQMSADRGKR